MGRKSDGPYIKAECACGALHQRRDLLDWTPIKCSCGREIKFPAPRRSFAEALLPPSWRTEQQGELPLRHVKLECNFIELQGWLIDLAKVTHARIDTGHIMLAQLNGASLIFENEEAAMDLIPGANQLEPNKFKALADYLRIRFNPEKVPVENSKD